jgi:hypothetical protein
MYVQWKMLVYLMTIWNILRFMFGKYSLWSFGVFCPLWYVWTNKNLATLGPML